MAAPGLRDSLAKLPMFGDSSAKADALNRRKADAVSMPGQRCKAWRLTAKDRKEQGTRHFAHHAFCVSTFFAQRVSIFSVFGCQSTDS